MLTITISPRTLLLAALLALGTVSALYASDALGSNQPDSILQGDTDCDGDVDATDALNDLRYSGGLTVNAFPGCPQVGAEAAIPGPTGPAGPKGDKGDKGDPGVSFFATVTDTGQLVKGSPGVAAGNEGYGAYYVDFGQDMSNCAVVASAGKTGASGETTVQGAVPYIIDTADDQGIVVIFYNPAIVLTSFHLIAAC